MQSTAFAIYRLPHEDHATLVQQTEGEPAELLSCTDLNGRSGFVVAPFEVKTGQPILLIRPDKVTRQELPAAVPVPVAAPSGSPQGNRYYYSIFHFSSSIALEFETHIRLFYNRNNICIFLITAYLCQRHLSMSLNSDE